MNGQRLYRSSDRIIGGVCAGLAEGFHVDALWVRVAFLILIFIQGIGVFLYIVLWLVMPERVEGGGQRRGFDAMTADISSALSMVTSLACFDLPRSYRCAATKPRGQSEDRDVIGPPR